MTAPEAAEFGRRLREAREARGLSLRQIANSTKIASGVLEALEQGEFSRLPGGIFGRAFVRSYAQEVGIDPDETVREFIERTLGASPSNSAHRPMPRADERERLHESQRRTLGVASKLVLISVPIAVLLMYLTFDRSPKGTTVPARATPTPAAAPSEASAPAAGAAASQVLSTLPPVAMEGAETAAQTTDSPTAPASVEEGFLLEVTATGLCWVSLTVDGAIVLSKVMAADERVSRRVRTGALIQVGDAGAFAFSLNGRPARPLGEPGEVRSVEITPANYVSFLR